MEVFSALHYLSREKRTRSISLGNFLPVTRTAQEVNDSLGRGWCPETRGLRAAGGKSEGIFLRVTKGSLVVWENFVVVYGFTLCYGIQNVRVVCWVPCQCYVRGASKKKLQTRERGSVHGGKHHRPEMFYIQAKGQKKFVRGLKG